MLHKDNNLEQAKFNALIASAAFPLELCDGKDYIGVIRDREMAQEMHIFELVVIEYTAKHDDEVQPWARNAFSPGKYVLQSTLDSSARMQWDPGIITTTSWGQAVFREAENVMT
jgi:hypothetical protein